MLIFCALFCLLSMTCIHSADLSQVSFLSKDPAVAAEESKVIDWALLNAAKNYGINDVQDKIERELYSYLQEDERDHDTCSLVYKDTSCLLHTKGKVTAQERENDYNFLKKQIELLPHVVEKEGITRTTTASVFVAMPPAYSLIFGLKNISWAEKNPNPAVFVQVVIEKHKDYRQNRINKNYLLARLWSVCENESARKQ